MENEKRLIDKEKLLEKLTWLAKNEDQFRQTVICGVMHTIAVTPTVDAVEVVHGEWTTIEDDWTMDTIYKCSVCKEEFVTIDGTPAENLWNYCPNCGAKMDGADNG